MKELTGIVSNQCCKDHRSQRSEWQIVNHLWPGLTLLGPAPRNGHLSEISVQNLVRQIHLTQH